MDHSQFFILSSKNSIPFILNIIPIKANNNVIKTIIKNLKLKSIDFESIQFKTTLPKGAINENPII